MGHPGRDYRIVQATGYRFNIVPRPSCTRRQGGHGLWLASLHVRPFQRHKTGMGHGQLVPGLEDICPGHNILHREAC